MDFTAFGQLLCDRLRVGLVMNNPGGGTSTVMRCSDEEVCYRRGDHRFYIATRDLYDAFQRFSGDDVTTNQLKDYKPAIFDTDRNGHNCHCTFFFLALQRMGLAGEIWGRGTAGSSFGVSLAPNKHPPSQAWQPTGQAIEDFCGSARHPREPVAEHVVW
jgi:hypothetical protein